MKPIFTTSLFAALACVALNARPFELPSSPYLANELTPYPIAADSTLTGPGSATAILKKLPRGYKPFYISHYGRHGSRTENNIKRFEQLMSTFRRSSDAGILTSRGDSIYTALKRECDFAQGRLGFLTPLGVQQHKGIANRMADTFPQVFAGKSPKVDSRSSRYPRCILSMTSFVAALSARFPSIGYEMEASERMSKQLNFHNPQEYYDSTNLILTSALASMKSDTLAALSSVFTDVKAAGNYYKSAGDLFNSLYYAAGMALNIPGDVDIFRFFNDDVLEEILRVNNDNLYLDNCNGKRWGDVCLRGAERLAWDFVDRADDAVAGKGNAADLRFGHDGAILTLVSLLGAPGVPDGLEEGKITGFYMGSVIPMAANLQIIFFRSSKSPDEVLTLCLLNERAFVPAGINPVYGDFCRWSDLRKKFLRQ